MSIALLLGLGLGSGHAAPLHGCTFHKARLKTASWPGGLGTGCANLEVKPLSCTKTRTVAGVPVTYLGDVVSGRLPAYFIEVTPYKGFSIFAIDPDGVVLKPQLKSAATYWDTTLSALSPLAAAASTIPFGGQGTQVDAPGNNGGMLFARAIKVPYAGLAWSFPSIGVSSGSVFPTCFDGISEHTPHTWADVLGHGETAMTALHLPIATPLCHTDAAGMLLPEVLVGTPWDTPRNICSFPTTPALVSAAVLNPLSEAMEALTNPRKVCAGRLGNHLPRTGVTHTSSRWDAAQTVAYRFATLAEDHWQSGPGIEPGDRWQLVWPPTASPGGSACFRPGSIRIEEMWTNGPLAMPALPASDGPIRPGGLLAGYTQGGSNHVFAVWRRFERCVEPGQGALFTADVAALQPAREAVCASMNATDGMP